MTNDMAAYGSVLANEMAVTNRRNIKKSCEDTIVLKSAVGTFYLVHSSLHLMRQTRDDLEASCVEIFKM
jgi:hypothetical protein